MNQVKAALITGASHGIGYELAKKLLDNHWFVFGTGRDIGKLNQLKLSYSQFIPIQADFTKNKDIEHIVHVIKHSGMKLTLNVQNAGMKSPPRALHEYLTAEAIDEVMQVNLLAPMKLTALLTEVMLPQSRLLYITSRAATLHLKESSTYCASKAGLDSIAHIVRQELAEKQIAVASVIPGEVDTGIQRTLRETKSFHLHEMFLKAYENGQLISPSTCAEFLKWLLCDLPFEQYQNTTIPVSIYDDWHKEFWLAEENALPAFPF